MSRGPTSMPSSRAALAVCLCAASSAACGGDGDFAQLVVLVRSDLAREFVSDVSLTATSPDRTPRTMSAPAGWSFPLSHGLLWNGQNLGPVDVEAQALDEEGIPIVSSWMSTEFVAGETRLVTLDLTAACAGYVCPELCLVGRCVDDFERETPQFDGEPFLEIDRCDGADNDDDGAIDEAADDTSQATCGAGCARCEESVCVDGACVPGPVEDVRASSASVCAVHESGYVTCWGDNIGGELGRSAVADGAFGRAQPKAVLGLDPVRGGTLTAGFRHFCALVDPNGEVVCWGLNEAGQLGPNAELGASSPPVRTGVIATRVDAGGYHTCAVDAGGAVTCWGENAAGQLDGTPAAAASGMLRAGPVAGASAIATGYVHTCAIVAGGDVVCWGDNTHGQLGGAPMTVVVRGASDIEAGTSHTCAIVGSDQHVECWGSNEAGELGTTGAPTTPVSLPLTNVVQLSSAVRIDEDFGEEIPSHTCARTMEGAVHCWGTNDSMQVGSGAGTGPQRITRLPGAARAVAAGGYHTSVVVEREVLTWGSNLTGQWGAWSIVSLGSSRMQVTDVPVVAVLP